MNKNQNRTCFTPACKTNRKKEREMIKDKNKSLHHLWDILLNHDVLRRYMAQQYYPDQNDADIESEKCKESCHNEIRPKYLAAGYDKPEGQCYKNCDNYQIWEDYDVDQFLDELNEI